MTHSSGNAGSPVGRAALVMVVIVTLSGAAVALAYAGWDAPSITGLLAALLALEAPLLALIYKTDAVHRVVNQKATDARVYEADLIDVLRNAGVDVPRDKSLQAPANPNATVHNGPSTMDVPPKPNG